MAYLIHLSVIPSNLPKFIRDQICVASLSDINFSIVETKVVGWTGDNVYFKVGGDS